MSPLKHKVGSRVAALFVRSTIARRQEATDPQSPKGGSQRPANTEGAHPTASGRLAMAVRTQPLRDASRGSESSMVGSWVAALQLTNGGVVNAVVPCGPRGNSSTAWV